MFSVISVFDLAVALTVQTLRVKVTVVKNVLSPSSAKDVKFIVATNHDLSLIRSGEKRTLRCPNVKK